MAYTYIPSEAATCILNQIKTSTGVWAKGWESSILEAMHPLNPLTETLYHGVNALNLYLPILQKISTDPNYITELRYSTLRQLNMNGARVREGAKAHHIICYKVLYLDQNGKIIRAKNLEEAQKINPDVSEKKIRKSYAVFNYVDVEWLDLEKKAQVDKFRIDPYEIQNFSSNGNAERLLKGCGVRLLIGSGMQPCFAPHENIIYVPRNGDFGLEGCKWEALFHELIHWTKQNLSGCQRRFCYAQEELTAEIGSLMLCQELGVSFVPGQKDGMLDYLRSWLKPFPNELMQLSAIDDALKAAEKAVGILISLMKKVQ